MNNLHCTFLRGATQLDELPSPHFPEIAFAGRSNVGKSSLINAMTGQKNLARSSSTPGRTQELNFFNCSDRFLLVDLPGYGYAKAPQKKVAAWQRLIRDYIAGRQVLRRIFVLIDARHGIKANDDEFLDFLDSVAVPAVIVLTKSDKIKKADLDNLTEQTIVKIKKHSSCYPNIVATSAEKGDGLEKLRTFLDY